MGARGSPMHIWPAPACYTRGQFHSNMNHKANTNKEEMTNHQILHAHSSMLHYVYGDLISYLISNITLEQNIIYQNKQFADITEISLEQGDKE